MQNGLRYSRRVTLVDAQLSDELGLVTSGRELKRTATRVYTADLASERRLQTARFLQRHFQKAILP